MFIWGERERKGVGGGASKQHDEPEKENNTLKKALARNALNYNNAHAFKNMRHPLTFPHIYIQRKMQYRSTFTIFFLWKITLIFLH